MKHNIAPERLHECLYYSPRTGKFFWIESRRGMRRGQQAGTIGTRGYRQIKLDGTIYYAHRLAWLYIHGNFPKDQVDHKNRVRADNRIVNLREATNRDNHRNQSMPSTNSSGCTGVYNTNNGQPSPWQADIRGDNGVRRRKYFATFEEAVAQRQAWMIEFGYDPTHGR